MLRHVDMQDAAPVVGEDDEDKQDLAGECRDPEEVDRDGRAEVVLEECAPGLQGGLRRRGIRREIVRSETSNPSVQQFPV
jgi:hypothetical protein